jgi:nitrogen fixation/metabolism regulation signal transduction histidine kinase
MAIATIIIGAATIWVTLFVSHKISGPLYHFKKAMKTLEDGDFSSSFNLRQLDQLQDLSDTFNNMINKLRKQLNIIKNDFGTLKIRLDALSENDVSEYKRHLLKALKNLLQDLSKAIDYFKS